jgi:hypothetical protein
MRRQAYVTTAHHEHAAPAMCDQLVVDAVRQFSFCHDNEFVIIMPMRFACIAR